MTPPTPITWSKPTPILVDLPDELVGPRVLLRPWRSGDGPALFEAVEESREHIEPWLPWGPFHKAVTDSEVQARKFAYRWVSREDLAVSVWDKSTGQFLGGAGLHNANWDVPSFEIGYWLRKTAEGHGYMTETVRLLMALAFDTLRANRLFVRCAVGNLRSSSIPKRLGFTCEGTVRNHLRNTLGELYDVDVYSMLPGEWVKVSGDDGSAGRRPPKKRPILSDRPNK